MCVFSQVRFDSVGGLSNHIQSLKEMVVFPLIYPEIFEKFKIQPPRWDELIWVWLHRCNGMYVFMCSSPSSNNFFFFSISSPSLCRGCLFYGPPGTGKTLVARALANECSHGDRKVSFFMRKGADCLSKWVGESERQLRLLFDQVRLTNQWVCREFLDNVLSP